MRLYGKKISRLQALTKMPDISQLCGTRAYELLDGATRGTRVIDVNTGVLRYSVVVDRGMDISLASYKGVNLTHLTENGEINPAFYESRGKEWARIFFGGLVTTCGLTHLGPPGRDGEEELGLHGRYSAIPARHVKDNSNWQGDEYCIQLEGQMDETVQMGYKMRLIRRITSYAGESVIKIQDIVTNTGSYNAPFTILYHINFGFPLLDAGTRINVRSNEIHPFDSYSASRSDTRLKVTEPVRGFMEENYFCSGTPDENGYNWAMIANDTLMDGLGVYIKTSADTLPYFCHWNMLDERDYIVALEPSNVVCENRSVLRERNQLPILLPGESRAMNIEIGVVEGKRSIRELEERIKL